MKKIKSTVFNSNNRDDKETKRESKSVGLLITRLERLQNIYLVLNTEFCIQKYN